jgi:NifB/MoaA-like Fe-S oxidoreductase
MARCEPSIRTAVFCADEFYLVARSEMPAGADYHGYPQYENGIGLVRAFEDELADGLQGSRGLSTRGSRPFTLVTGELFAPVLARLGARLEAAGHPTRVLPVRNRFLGGNVSVAGLLTGEDVLATIGEDTGEGPYLVPDIVANTEGLMLDDVPALELGALSGKDVRLVPTDGAGFLETLREMSSATGGGPA